MSFPRRPAPPAWKILLYCVILSVGVILIGKLFAAFMAARL